MSSLALSTWEEGVIRRILAEHVPGVRVVAFGSRVTGRARRWSDLDLMLLASKPILLTVLDDLREAFAESDLTFRVDVVDAMRVDEEFRSVALRQTSELA